MFVVGLINNPLYRVFNTKKYILLWSLQKRVYFAENFIQSSCGHVKCIMLIYTELSVKHLRYSLFKKTRFKNISLIIF